MSYVIWLTGLPGSGKSDIAKELLNMMHEDVEIVEYLSLNQIAKKLIKNRVYDDEERELIYKEFIKEALKISESVPVVLDASGYKKKWRDEKRQNK